MNFKEKRKKKGLSQVDVSVRAGISLQGYQLIERGVTKNPGKETIRKLKEILGD